MGRDKVTVQGYSAGVYVTPYSIRQHIMRLDQTDRTRLRYLVLANARRLRRAYDFNPAEAMALAVSYHCTPSDVTHGTVSHMSDGNYIPTPVDYIKYIEGEPEWPFD